MSVAVVARSATAAVAGLGALTMYRYRGVMERQRQLPQHSFSVFDEQQHPEQNQRRAIVIGAGVVGVATAYQLARRGYQVAVLEPMPEPGEECSACAAGGMQRSNPVVDRDSWIAVAKCFIPKWIYQHPPFDFFHISWLECLTDPFFLRWVLTFTQTSLWPSAQQADKQNDMLAFTDKAVQDMIRMLERNRGYLGKQSGYNTRGSLAVSYDPPKPPAEQEKEQTKTPKAHASQSKMNLEPARQLVGTDQVLREEPSLRFQKQQPTGAKYEYEAKAASSGRFSKALADVCKTQSRQWDLHKGGKVTFFYDTRVQGITTAAISSSDSSSSTNKDPGQITRLHTNRGVIDCSVVNDKDQNKAGTVTPIPVVVAAGAWVPHILSLMDWYAPVYPLKGYSMSVSAKEALESSAGGSTKLSEQDLPSRIVADKYMYTTRLGKDEIRITSIGEFSGWSTQPTALVDKEFRREAVRQFPQLETLIDKAVTRCGHRPLVNDGILLLGRVSDTSNVYVSCGPGSNGWKLAMGSGDAVARLIEGQSFQQIQQEMGANVQTFDPSGRVMHAPWFAKLCRARWDI